MLNLVSNCIDRLNVYNSAAHFGECAGQEAGAAWKDILNLLYELLGKMGPAYCHLITFRPGCMKLPNRFNFASVCLAQINQRRRRGNRKSIWLI